MGTASVWPRRRRVWVSTMRGSVGIRMMARMKTSPITLAVASGLLAVTGLAVQAVHADGGSKYGTEIVALDRHSSSIKALVIDSDGDGWTYWVQRLEGTDPSDPSDHPQAVRLSTCSTARCTCSRRLSPTASSSSTSRRCRSTSRSRRAASSRWPMSSARSRADVAREVRRRDALQRSRPRRSDQLDGILAEAVDVDGQGGHLARCPHGRRARLAHRRGGCRGCRVPRTTTSSR